MATGQAPAALGERLIEPVTNISDFIWGGTWNGEQLIPIPPLAVILLGVGLWIMVGLRFYPIVKFGAAVRGLFASRKGSGSGEISPFAALSTALSGQVGTGNLAGVATAIALGGPGAVFWMWVTALFGMALAFAEGSLAIRYRETTSDGVARGGPMSYIMMGLGPKWTWLAIVFCLGTLFSALVTGNSIQANEVASGLNELFGLERWLGGLIVAIAVFVVIIGGIKSIGNVAEKVVPFMAAAYIVMAITALILNFGDLPETFGRIFGGAFNAQSASGGFVGAAIILAIRAGVARGLFSNEAGQGSTPMAHAVAQTDDPEQQGRMAMLGTFIDTIVICTMTALVILTVQGDFTYNGQPVDHVWQSDLGTTAMSGFVTTSGAFAAAFPFEIFSVPLGTFVASVALILFVFTTMLTWSYYGERAITFIYDRVPGSTRGGEKKLHVAWRVIWCIAIFIGATQPSQLVWRLGDISNATMALPNLLALALLSGVVFKLARGERTAGRDYHRETSEEPEEY
ncbi:alanine/glycine:cation symporter family protein [Pelagerythrobacter rhizovicinus]|uniref:Alanine:cation symporter family protein n=1 Tax=Pelagerythrobacter rhizovicinus TaxID=2268576 RepID=A0A4Q2KM18_9SPHN|nr:alanine/glycine:cation symporter family protein [Pelagerythrobacter rhizovicinus]RXZ64201.1 alanine:cation symporter family protein [Pelagerythrobacter rhizovicinus]